MDQAGTTGSGRVRRAHALWAEFGGPALRVTNLLTRRVATVTAPVAGYLRGIAEPVPDQEALRRLPVPDGRAGDLLCRLLESTLVLRVGSPAELADRRFAGSWRFGLAAAAMHHDRRAARVVDPAERADAVRAAAAEIAAVPLALRHPADVPVVRLPQVDADPGVLELMVRRRSARGFAATPVGAPALARVLFAMVARTGGVVDPVTGSHPLSAAPSGGARNPYEAYVFVHRVEGVDAGTYHYDQYARTLLRLGDPPADPATVAGGQEWARDAAFVVVLVAFFDRVWVKYPGPGGYVNVLIEAGHRAQNALLVGTECGLGARMTSAIDTSIGTAIDTAIGTAAGCPAGGEPVYLLAFGHPAEGS